MFQSSARFRSLSLIFSIVLMEFTAFGMIIPLSPYLARDFGADDLEVGLLMSVYSLAQLVFAPLWGYLSDRLGRRPIILICLLGSSFFYLWFSFATTLETLFLTRILAGVFGAVMSVAMACIADVTGEKERSKNMGLVGAAIGLGFIIGPFLGGIFGFLGRHWGGTPPFGSSFAAFGAFLVCVINLLIAFCFLKESFAKSDNSSLSIKNILLSIKNIHQSRIRQLLSAFRYPVLNQTLFMYFLLTLALAGIEASLFLYVRDRLSWSHFPASIGFTYIGLMMVLTQGFLVRKLIPAFGERKIVMWGLIVAGIGFAGVGMTNWLWFLAMSVTLLCVGYGLASTCLSGAVSLLTSRDQQGGIFGVHQSLFSMGRIMGPALGGWFYRDISPSSPFFISGLFALFALFVGLSLKGRFPQKGKVEVF